MKLFSDYLNTIARANGLGNSDGLPAKKVDWLFYTGMLPESREKWWADFSLRHAAHEGIDICFYRTGSHIAALAPGARVPAMVGGIILNISNDLLGKSMAVSLDSGGAGADTPILVYSHLEPAPGLFPGDRISKGQIIANTFDARLKKSRLLSHLHLSCVLIPPPVENTALDWSLFANRNKVTYVNPVFL